MAVPLTVGLRRAQSFAHHWNSDARSGTYLACSWVTTATFLQDGIINVSENNYKDMWSRQTSKKQIQTDRCLIKTISHCWLICYKQIYMYKNCILGKTRNKTDTKTLCLDTNSQVIWTDNFWGNAFTRTQWNWNGRHFLAHNQNHKIKS